MVIQDQKKPFICKPQVPRDLRGKVVDAHGEDGAADQRLGRPEEVGVDQLVVNHRLGVHVLEDAGYDVVKRIGETLLLASDGRPRLMPIWRGLGGHSFIRAGQLVLHRGLLSWRGGHFFVSRVQWFKFAKA